MGYRVAVVGATGNVGSALVRKLAGPKPVEEIAAQAEALAAALNG